MLVNPMLWRSPQYRGDRPVGKRPGDVKLRVEGNECLPFEDCPDGVDGGLGEMGEIGQGLVLDLAVLAVGPAQEVGRVDPVLVLATGGEDMHRIRLPRPEAIFARPQLREPFRRTAPGVVQAVSAGTGMCLPSATRFPDPTEPCLQSLTRIPTHVPKF